MPEAPTPLPALPGETRTLWLMVGIQFVMTLSFTVLSPVMPLFLPDLGVHGAAAIDLWTGVVNAATPFVAAFVTPWWGRLGDRTGRKLMLMRSMIAISIFTGLMGLSQNIWQFFGLRLLMGAFSGFSAAAITLVATRTRETRLGYALGWLSTGQLVGGLSGPLLGGFVHDSLDSSRAPFFVTCAIASCATLAAWLLVQEGDRPARGAKGRGAPSFRAIISAGGLLPLFAVLLLAQLGVRSVQPVITLYVQTLVHDPGALATLSGLAFSMTGLADVIASPFLGKRSDTLGYRRVLLISLFGAALFSAPQAFAPNFWVFAAERFGVGLFIGGILPTANALIGRIAGPAQRGAVFGLTASATFFGNAVGPLVGGGVAAAFGLHWVFLVTAILLAASLVWTWIEVPATVE
jgi:DHA1 family multidrug resistance protein-like MFS transporter